MKPVELENRLISSIASYEDVLYCQREGITDESFVSEGEDTPDHGQVFEYIAQHARENSGDLPTPEDLSTLYDFEPNGEPGDLKSYVREIRKREVGRKALSFLQGIVKRLDTDNPVEVVSEIADEFAKLRTVSKSAIEYIDADALERLEDFDTAQESVTEGKMIGIPTGLSTFDKQYLGFTPGEVVVVIGGTGIGKSWLLLYMAAVAHKNEKKILLVSPELTIKEQAQRFDPIRSHLDGVTLSNQGIITGQENREMYKGWLEHLAKDRRFAAFDRSEDGQMITFDEIWRQTAQVKPDVVMVDGLHLIAGRSKGEQKGWEVLKEGIDSLKAMAQKEGVVVLAAHQPTRDASSKKQAGMPPGLAQVAYGFSVAQSADRVLSLARDPDSELHRLYRVIKQRAGQPIIEVRRLYFDVDKGKVHEVAYEAPEAFETSNDFG